MTEKLLKLQAGTAVGVVYPTGRWFRRLSRPTPDRNSNRLPSGSCTRFRCCRGRRASHRWNFSGMRSQERRRIIGSRRCCACGGISGNSAEQPFSVFSLLIPILWRIPMSRLFLLFGAAAMFTPLAVAALSFSGRTVTEPVRRSASVCDCCQVCRCEACVCDLAGCACDQGGSCECTGDCSSQGLCCDDGSCCNTADACCESPAAECPTGSHAGSACSAGGCPSSK